MASNEKLQIDITAKDDASKVIDPLQKKVAKLEQGKTTVKVDADTKAAQSDVESFSKKLAKLTAEDQVVLLSLKAAAAQTELTQLGTDLADIDSSDPTVEVKLERYEQVSGDLEQLQTKIKAIGSTPVDAGGLGGQLTGVTTKLEGMRGEADQSRSVLANMVGNSAQDIGNLGGVAGTTGVAIGQLAEYAADGNISLTGLAKVAGPMLLVGVAITTVTSIMGTFKKQAEEAAKIKAFNVGNAKEYADAVAAGNDAVDHYVETAKGLGKIQVAPSVDDQNKALHALDLLKGSYSDASYTLNKIGFELTHGIRDIGDSLVTAGQSADQFFAAAADPAKLQAFTTSIQKSNLPLNEQVQVLAAVYYQQGRFAAGQDEAKKQAVLFTAAQQAVNDNVAEGAGLLNGLSTSTGRAATAEENAAAVTKLLADTQQRLANQVEASTAAFDALKGTVSDDQAFLNLQNTFDQVRTSSQDAWDATSTGAVDAAQKVRANKSDVNSLKQSIIDYAQNVAGLPTDQVTNILAKVDAGQLDEVEAQIARIKANAAINVSIIAKGGAGFGPNGQARATGGPVRKGEAYLVGDGPGGSPTPWSEIFIPNSDGTILNAPQTKRALQSRATGGSTGPNITHITLPGATVAGTGAISADDTVKEQDRIQAAMYETGRVSLDAYKKYVQGRMAQSADLSDDWLAQYRLLNQLTSAEQARADKDKQAADDAVKTQAEVQKAMFETGAISLQSYEDYLKGRLGAYQAYSQDWLDIYGQIKSLTEQEVKDHNDAEQAAYRQAQANKAAAEAQAEVDKQTNATFAAGAAGGRIQGDRNATDADKASAVQKLMDEQTKLADDVYKAVLAQATQQNLQTGTVPWDRFVRGLLQSAIDNFNANGLTVTAAALAGPMSGIPALANGGIIKATPGGTLVRAGEAGKDEAVVPLDSGFGATVNHHYTIELHSLSKPTAREMAMLAEELAKLQRRNGRSLTAVS